MSPTSVIALAATGAFADGKANGGAAAATTRSEIRAEVLNARAAGKLFPAGTLVTNVEAYGPDTSAASRADILKSVLSARANGQLQPAGVVSLAEIEPQTASTLTRAEVKAETVSAGKAGELAPAGEVYVGITSAKPRDAAATNPFKKLARFFHGKRDASPASL